MCTFLNNVTYSMCLVVDSMLVHVLCLTCQKIFPGLGINSWFWLNGISWTEESQRGADTRPFKIFHCISICFISQS